jgi:transposase-like protein
MKKAAESGREVAKVRKIMKKERALALLAIGESYSETARQVGISRNTLDHWRRDPEFAARLDKRQEEVCESLDDIIRKAGPLAARHFVRVLEEERGKVRDQNHAAEVILKYQDKLKANDSPTTVIGDDMDEEKFESFKAKMKGVE